MLNLTAKANNDSYNLDLLTKVTCCSGFRLPQQKRESSTRRESSLAAEFVPDISSPCKRGKRASQMSSSVSLKTIRVNSPLLSVEKSQKKPSPSSGRPLTLRSPCREVEHREKRPPIILPTHRFTVVKTSCFLTPSAPPS